MDSGNSGINVEIFLNEIKKLKLTGREFLALIGNSKISNETYREIKDNPGLTYRKLVEILEASALNSGDYEKLLIAARERFEQNEEERRKYREKKLTAAVAAAGKRIDAVRENDEHYRIREVSEIRETPEFLVRKPEHGGFYENKRENEINSLDFDHDGNENDEEPNSFSDYGNSDNNDDIENYTDNYTESYSGKYKKADYDIDDDEDNNNGKIILCLILGFLLLVLSFGLRYYYTGTFALTSDETDILTAPADYTELALILSDLKSAAVKSDGTSINEYYYTDTENVIKPERNKILHNDKYIFTVIDDTLYAVEANGTLLKQAGTIKKEGMSLREIFLSDNRLYAVFTGEYDSEYYSENPLNTHGLTETTAENQPPAEPVSGSFSQPFTLVDVFDAAEFSEKPLTEITLDGTYDRLVFQKDYTFIFTDYQITNANAHDDLRAFVPSFTVNGKKEFINLGNIYLPLTGFDYSAVKAFCRIGKDLAADAGAVLGGKKIGIYSGNSSVIFICMNGEKTNLIRLANDKSVYFAEIDGIAEEYSADERKGIIRVCAENADYSKVYIFNDILEPLSVIEGIAGGEKIKTVLFDDNFIYIITDLLYAFDTTVPDEPLIAENTLVNIYNDDYYRWSDKERLSVLPSTDEEGKRTGILLEMMKIEKGSYTKTGSLLINTDVLGLKTGTETLGGFIRTPAENDKNSLYYNSETGIILLPVIYFDGISEIERYLFIEYYGAEGFSIKGDLVYYDYNKKVHRAVQIGDYIYTFWDKTVISSKIASIAEEQSIELID